MAAPVRIRPHRRVPVLLLLSITLSFMLMLSYNPSYLNYDIKRVFRVVSRVSNPSIGKVRLTCYLNQLGYEGKESMPRLSLHHSDTQSSMNSHRVPHNPQLKTHVLPWRILPYGSYRYDDPDFGGHNQPFVYAADISATIPLNSEAMYVLGDGDGLGSGLINIFEDPDEKDEKFTSGDVQISLRMYYNSPQMVKFTNISYVQSPQGERGLRIHVSYAIRSFCLLGIDERCDIALLDSRTAGYERRLGTQIHCHNCKTAPLLTWLPSTAAQLPYTPPQLRACRRRPRRESALQIHNVVILKSTYVH